MEYVLVKDMPPKIGDMGFIKIGFDNVDTQVFVYPFEKKGLYFVYSLQHEDNKAIIAKPIDCEWEWKPFNKNSLDLDILFAWILGWSLEWEGFKEHLNQE